MGEATPNIYSARPRGVDVVAAGVAIVIDRCSSSLTPGLVLELNQSGKIQAYGVVQPSSVVFPGSNK
ncbi:hypothetical protein Y032_0211g2180 [Ancylostoma ceylanicum]|uniref:Uncharacterized protein n=1 Tax=Ancylostoma ceylanicum TaxID=53326 RepID=A0A016SKY1_9BILA|nr:hypothetical protein Y032_0211g2180 [Ancylostoma ceylanicum]